MHCVYLTLYSGSLLPPFYIGSSTVEKVEAGYRGSVSSRKYAKIWKQELSVNPHLFKTKIISTHATSREALAKERAIHQAQNVVSSPLHINMVVAGEKFDFSGRKHDPVSIQKMKSRVMTAEHKAKIAAAAVGRKQTPETIAKRVAKNIGQKRSEETKIKMGLWERPRTPQSAESNAKRSASCTGYKHTSETRAKIAAAAQKQIRPKQSKETIVKRVASMKLTAARKAALATAASPVQA